MDSDSNSNVSQEFAPGSPVYDPAMNDESNDSGLSMEGQKRPSGGLLDRGFVGVVSMVATTVILTLSAWMADYTKVVRCVGITEFLEGILGEWLSLKEEETVNALYIFYLLLGARKASVAFGSLITQIQKRIPSAKIVGEGVNRPALSCDSVELNEGAYFKTFKVGTKLTELFNIKMFIPEVLQNSNNVAMIGSFSSALKRTLDYVYFSRALFSDKGERIGSIPDCLEAEIEELDQGQVDAVYSRLIHGNEDDSEGHPMPPTDFIGAHGVVVFKTRLNDAIAANAFNGAQLTIGIVMFCLFKLREMQSLTNLSGLVFILKKFESLKEFALLFNKVLQDDVSTRALHVDERMVQMSTFISHFDVLSTTSYLSTPVTSSALEVSFRSSLSYPKPFSVIGTTNDKFVDVDELNVKVTHVVEKINFNEVVDKDGFEARFVGYGVICDIKITQIGQAMDKLIKEKSGARNSRFNRGSRVVEGSGAQTRAKVQNTFLIVQPRKDSNGNNIQMPVNGTYMYVKQNKTHINEVMIVDFIQFSRLFKRVLAGFNVSASRINVPVPVVQENLDAKSQIDDFLLNNFFE